MKIINDILYIEYSELLEVGVSKETLNSAKLRNSASWTFIKDPLDQRKVLISYENLRSRYKSLINSCYGNPYEYENCQKFDPYIKSNLKDQEDIRSYRYNLDERLSMRHIESYTEAAKYINLLHLNPKQVNCSSRSDLVQQIISLIKLKNINLPKSRSNLLDKYSQYKKQGAIALIKNNHGNQNRRLITPAISDWLIAQMSQPNIYQTSTDILKLYNIKRKLENWTALSEGTIYNHLFKNEYIRRIWELGKHGERSASYKGRYSHHLSLQSASARDLMWIIDGTKVDVVYQLNGGMIARMKMNVIMDLHSEKLLAVHFSLSEKKADHKEAVKEALTSAGTRPYQFFYDNQSGHKAKDMQSFYDNLIVPGGYHAPSKAYRSHAKPIEQLFNRLQKQILRKLWFSDGQGLNTIRSDSRPNMQFIEENKHRLPTEKQIYKLASYIKKTWNEANYPNSKLSRNDMYELSINTLEVCTTQQYMEDMFWKMSKRPSQYLRGGIHKEISCEDCIYEVYNEQGTPDLVFRQKYVGKKLIVNYSENNRSYINLYEQINGSIRFVAQADLKHKHTQVLADQKPGDKDRWDADYATTQKELDNDKAELERVRKSADVNPEQLFDAGELILKGGSATKEQLALAESQSFLNDM